MKYYILTAIEEKEARVILFGDYDRSIVVEEMRDIKYSDYDKVYTAYKIEVSQEWSQ